MNAQSYGNIIIAHIMEGSFKSLIQLSSLAVLFSSLILTSAGNHKNLFRISASDSIYYFSGYGDLAWLLLKSQSAVALVPTGH